MLAVAFVRVQFRRRTRLAGTLTVRRPDYPPFDVALDKAGARAALEVEFAEGEDQSVLNAGTPVLSVTVSRQVGQGAWRVLDSLTRQEWPEGFVPGTFGLDLFDFYPTELQELCEELLVDFEEKSQQVYGLLRWRFNDPSWVGERRYKHLGIEWSVDGTWHKLLGLLRISAGQPIVGMHASPNAAVETQRLVDTGVSEPLGREIWDVAWAAGQRSDIRSAVVLAVVAVEAELKRLIAELVPGTAWLMEEAPSPPIFKMVRDYLPTLQAIPKEYLPPKNVRSALHLAVDRRNDFVHKGTAEVPDVQVILRASSDLLWLFDLYRGQAWAADYLSAATKSELNLPAE